MEVYSDSNVIYVEEDGGCIINSSEDIVMLAKPEEIDLRAFWEGFNELLRDELRTLFKMKYGAVEARYGALQLHVKLREDRRDTPFGFVRSGTTIRLHVLEKKPVVQELVNLGLIQGKTPHGRPRQNFPKGDVTLAGFLDDLPYEDQCRIIDHVLARDLDDVLRITQRGLLGMKDLERLLFSRPAKASAALRRLAEEVERASAPGDYSKGGFAGSGTTYAPLWFAQYLAAEGIWLLPLRFLKRMFAFTPEHLKPLLPLLSVPRHSRDIADKIIGSKSPEASNLKPAPAVFAMAALMSNMWATRRFCPAPLDYMKMTLGTKNLHNSASINHVYKFLAHAFEVDMRSRPEARLLSGRQRASSVEAFRWVDHPEKSKLRKVSRLLGRDSRDISIPEHVRMLAKEMRSLLSTFKVQSMRSVRGPVELFLIYAMTLDPATAPRRLRDILRHEHVRSEKSGHETFFEFLKNRCLAIGAHETEAAMSKMQAIWRAAAIRDGFQLEVPCPFDPTYDRLPIKRGERERKGRALEREVIDILIELNRRDNWAFARSLGRYEYSVRVSDGIYEVMFWPAVPLILEITLRAGHRLRSVRWLDSGEGDQRWYDPITMTDRENTLPCAIAGRREFAVRYLRLDDSDRTPVNSMYLCVAKTGAYETPYCPPELIEPICELRDLQVRYNPINGPVPAIDIHGKKGETDESLFPKVFPLFRLPGVLGDVVSDFMMRSYYKEFLKYAQPIVAERLGRDIPLIDLERGKALTTFHDHRRSLVTNSEEEGVAVSIIRTHLGHDSEQTTNLYNRVRGHRVHALVQRATYNQSLIDRIAANDPDALKEIAEQVEAVSGKDAPQAKRLRQVASGKRPAFLDLFVHGMCVGGDCSAGGRLKRGTRLPVWRPRACGSCIFRGTGWAFRAGIVDRQNLLKIELRMSASKSAELNGVIVRAEAEGRPTQALNTLLRAEDELRRNLTNELRIEQDTLRRVDTAAKAARLAGRSPNTVILMNEALDLDKIETLEQRVHEFEMLHLVMKDAIMIPAGIVEIPPAVPFEIDRQVRTILRANSLEDVLHRIPADQKNEALVAIGDIFLDVFGEIEEFQRVLEASEQGVSNEVIAKVSERIRTVATNPAAVGRLDGPLFFDGRT